MNTRPNLSATFNPRPSCSRPDSLSQWPGVLAAVGAALVLALAACPSSADDWRDANIGTPAPTGSHSSGVHSVTVVGGGLGIDGGCDRLHYVYQSFNAGDIEIIARLSSFTGAPLAQTGIMLRSDNTPDSATAAIEFRYRVAPNTDPMAQTDGKLGTPGFLNWTGEFNRDPNAQTGMRSGGVNTPLAPPDIWLRLDRTGPNYAVYRSQDGKVWSMAANQSGGAFTPTGPIEVGFFAAGGDAAKPATATFDSIRIGKPDLGYSESCFGNTWSGDAQGWVSNGINAMWVDSDGACYTNSWYDEAGESAKVYMDGKVVRGFRGNSLAGEGAITGDGKSIYMFFACPGGNSLCVFPKSGDPNVDGKLIAMSTPMMSSTGSVVSGMAVSDGLLYVSDRIDNKILAARSDPKIYYATNNTTVTTVVEPIDTTGVANAAPASLYQSQRVCDLVPYVIPGLDPATKYTVRLHFADFDYATAGRRLLWIGAGAQSVDHYDIAATAGAKDRAVVKEFGDVSPNGDGKLAVTVRIDSDSPDRNAVLSGFEIIKPDGEVAFALNCGGNAVGRFNGEISEIPSREFAVDRPGAIVADKNGDLWIIQHPIKTTDTVPTVMSPGAVKCYTPDGKFTGRQITDVADPTAIALDPSNGRLLVADGGLEQNIKIYANIRTSPVRIGSFGARGGVYAGKIPGRVFDPAAGGWARFYQITAIGVDSLGNIYVNNSASGTDLRKFTPDGKLVWIDQALLFCNTGDFDPDSDGAQVYTPYTHESVAYDTNNAGAEWSYIGYGWDWFKFGPPPRSGGCSAVVRRLGPNRTLVLFTGGQGSVGDIELFRLEGEIWTPCGRIAEKNNKNEMWTDANGDGVETPNEVSSTARPGGLHSFDVDAKGDIWSVWDGDTFVLRHYIFKGIDSHGTPLYGLGASDFEDAPFPPPENATSRANVGRVVYDCANDVMYLIGPARPRVYPGDAFSDLARYDHWSKGNRTASWAVELPDPGTNPNFMYKSPDTYQWMAFDAVGDYVFVAEVWGPIHIYDAHSGKLVIVLNAAPSESGFCAWEDEQMGVRAFKRKNGEYVILEENSGFFGKDNLYRWRPAPH